jgi:hypothetical protein
MVLTKLNIAWAYFDIANFNKGLPYLNFINKHHSEFGNESTIVAKYVKWNVLLQKRT